MMDSHYQVQGDMVMTTITFVPTHQDKEVTCEASNEALSEPIRRTVVIEVKSDTSAKGAKIYNEQNGKDTFRVLNATVGSTWRQYRNSF